MLGNLARGMVVVILTLLTVVYIFSGDKRDARPPVPPDTIIGYMSV